MPSFKFGPVTRNPNLNDDVLELNTNETVTTNKQDIAVSSNDYFL
jgi:hypothetical protein